MTLSLLSMPRLGLRALLAALPAVLRQRQLEQAYRVYVTDALRVIGENTARYAGGGYLKTRYAALLDTREPDQRSAQEVADTIRARLRQMGGES